MRVLLVEDDEACPRPSAAICAPRPLWWMPCPAWPRLVPRCMRRSTRLCCSIYT